MPHEVIASVRVVLPEAPAEMAGALGEIAEAWSNFLTAFDQYEASSEVTFTVNETRSKPGPKPQRKPREKPPTVDDVRGILLPEETA
jgi:hypothetical protein